MEFQIIAGELCLDFINTLDNRPTPSRRKELLTTYQDLAEWASQAGAINAQQGKQLLGDAQARPKEAASILAKAITLRECLYRIVSSNLRSRHADAADLREFSSYLGDALSQLLLRPSRRGFRLEWTENPSNLASILWPVVRSASDLLTSEDLAYVRECDMETCRWMFIDRSKNHRRRWCDMKVCGNRAKARKFYRRQKHAS